MPIYLPAPAHDPRGPDGQGWNRMSISWGAVFRAQCALRPLYATKLFESHDTRRAAWGGFGPCLRDGDCTTCPVIRPRRRLESFTERVLVRVLERDGRSEYHVMNRPEQGWASRSMTWRLDDLAVVDGWTWDGLHYDEHGRGFWLRATRSPEDFGLFGIYGSAPTREEETSP
ncbi:hypothetical protein GCM10010156_49440 [Planobispora rosea]|uniref:Uncharacterized protein n=1 Tax=Planobispora rosea TaxID=35762 RepID=A0A8J3S5E9_PLARO|nr:hypothetical protein [Planobispora rosea]GGS84934.1 hypothetical protein GCM10010156_49440 [Planobispora rosea]GIH86455.1 hypothetical protein Pro02_48630 [Planobispora rosea]